jgi:shikimate dehydrogenase
MSKAVVAGLKHSGFKNVTITARNNSKGSALAAKYGFVFLGPALNEPGFQVLINATPIGMTGENQTELSFSKDAIAESSHIFEVVASPVETPLVVEARAKGKNLITGNQVLAKQAAIQFEKYTGVKLSLDQITRASEFSWV